MSIFENYGAYTGEISAQMLKDVNVRYVIVGHSERRLFLNETQNTLIKKINNILDMGMIPVYCVGENLSTREKKEHMNFVSDQLDILKSINLKGECVIAYEPIWAIGTGIVPHEDEVSEMINFISAYTKEHLNVKMQLLYGGSVNINNAKNILAIDNIGGVLVGGSSLNPEEFINIINAVG